MRQLKKIPLIAAFTFLIGLSAATTTVLANSQAIVVKASVLNVRLGPGMAYDVMGQVTHNTRLEIISQRNSWYQVRLAGNKIGWVASWLVANDEPTTDSAKVAQVTASTVLRQYPTEDATELTSINPGDTVNVIYQDGNWSQVAYKQSAAWIETKMINLSNQTTKLSIPQQAAAPSTANPKALMVVTNRDANIRQAAGINAPIVVHAPKDTRLQVLKQDGDWYQVKTTDGKVGFIASWTVSLPGDPDAKVAKSLAEATVVLDPGHGGADAGAISNSGKYEKNYTLAIAQTVAETLRSLGVNVLMTRNDDTFVDLAAIPAIASRAHADAFISFHFDSSPNPNTATGFTTYYFDTKQDKALASAINQSLAKNIKLDNRGIAYGNFEVLRDNLQPAVLLEMGYINSERDFQYIRSDAYHQQVAQDIVTGLTNYFKAGNHQ